MAQHHKQQQQQRQRRRTRRGGVVALVAAASAAFLLISASRVLVAAVDITADESTIAAPSSLSSSLGPVFIAEEAAENDDRVEVSEEELILEAGALESLMQVSSSGREQGSEDEAADGYADARLQAAVEGVQAAAAAVAPVCSSLESCLALCPTDNFLVAGGATEGSVEESVSFFGGGRRTETVSREQQLKNRSN